MQFFQAATSQVCPSRSARPSASLALALGPQPCSGHGARPLALPSRRAQPPPYCSLRRLRGPNLTFGKLLLEKIAYGKVPLGKKPLGKYLTPVKIDFKVTIDYRILIYNRSNQRLWSNQRLRINNRL